jgi:hypothetical protein
MAVTFKVGRRVEAESESTQTRPRTGVIEEVLRGDPSPRYRIRWDDGHESILTPADGALRAARGRTRAAGKSATRTRERKGDGSAAAGGRKRRTPADPESDEPPHYYRDEEQHIQLLE